MPEDDVISLGSDSGDEAIDRRAVLEGPIRAVVDALGGYEGGVYRMGDECYGCLKDLKKYWRKDDTDDERTVARIFWDTRVLPNDLVPILLQTPPDDRRAIATADLMTAMTWPIDLAEELRELDEEADRGTDYTALLRSHLQYKAALLRPGVLQALFAIALPCLGRDAKERTERDVQVVNVVLHLVRNLAFIKDLPANAYLSADQAELSTLQSRLIKGLSETYFLDLLLTITSNAGDDPLFNQWNALALEILYLLFRGIKPASLASDQAKEPAQALKRLLAVEDDRRRDLQRKASSRHSRFGTTIAVSLNTKKAPPAAAPTATDVAGEGDGGPSRAYVLHRQQALTKDASNILDLRKKKGRVTRGGPKKVDELAREDNLSVDARQTLQTFARTLVETSFNALVASLLKDIKAERAKITEKDNVRLLFVTKWFLEFFLCERARQEPDKCWAFGLVAEVTDRAWIVWVLRRMREAHDEKPKLWTELQAGVECLTQFVRVVDAMAAADVNGARALQQQIVYNGEVLDIAFDSVRTYKEGVQSLAYLDSSVHLAYALLRMLEKWSKGAGETYVRKKAAPKKRKGKAGTTEEGEGVPDVEEEPEEDREKEEMINETMFTFQQFESKFAHADVTHTLLTYLARYKEFTSPEQMKRVVGLMHRQVVKAKAEGLYFMVSTMDLFRQILAEERSLPKDQPYKDLISLIKYILKMFFKALSEDSFLLVQAFFPKNRGSWKKFSSWQPPVGKTEESAPLVVDTRFPPDVQVKKGYTWSEQLGIAMAALVDADQMQLIEWVKRILSLCIAHRQRIIEDTDGTASQAGGDDSDIDINDEIEALRGMRNPSAEAMEKISDYLIPYLSEEEAEAANKNVHLKLMFRLVKFEILDQDAEELEWHIPKAVFPSDLQRSLNVINQFIENPLDLQGKTAASLLQKKKRPARRRRRSPIPDASDAEATLADKPKRESKKAAKKKKEEKKYKSAQFIEDSDLEPEEMEAFLAKEKALRDRTERIALETGRVATMRKTGTKKRRRAADEGGAEKKRRKRRAVETDAGADADVDAEPATGAGGADASDSDESELDVFGSPKNAPPMRAASTPGTSPPSDASGSPKPKPKPKVKPRPRPRPKARKSATLGVSSPPPSDEVEFVASTRASTRSISTPPAGDVLELSDDDVSISAAAKRKGRLQLVISDDED